MRSAVEQLKQQGAYDSLMAAFEAARARVEPVKAPPAESPDADYFAANPWQRLRAYFAAGSVDVLPDTGGGDPTRWRLRLSGYGRGESLRPVLAADPVAKDNRVEYARGSLTEWYINDARGLEQGFTLAEPPTGCEQGSRPLVLAMAVESDLKPQLNAEGDSLQFVSSDGDVRLHYTGLKAWDATGRELSAHMQASEGHIALVVDDREATYPLTVDPLIFIETKLTASDAASSDAFGFSVAISGDTVVVGAPFDETIAGSAYVFVRSGSMWTEQSKLTASDAAEGDAFGNSVAISGDTVVVGAVADDTAAGSDTGSAYVFVNATEADLLLSLGVDKTEVRKGDLLTYTITVRNFGPNRAVNTVVNDVLSSGTTFVRAHANKGGFTAPPPGQTGTVTWYPGDLLNGDQEAAQIQVTVIVRGRTTITNTATVFSETFDPNMANNSASITTSVAPGGKK
ncbi:MAG TPA: hypothetical protein VNO70_00905 [Blastocatellia bacterium]|nr:hypothetical protein [Blastocatellia bacterium]